MGKRHPNLPAWQWRAYPGNHQHPTNLVLHLIAVPLFIVAFLLIVSGVFSLSLASVAIGVIGILAALGLQRHGHSLEAQASEPFSDRKDAVTRLLVEQFLTFPRFFSAVAGGAPGVSATVGIESGKDRHGLATHGYQLSLRAPQLCGDMAVTVGRVFDIGQILAPVQRTEVV
jgi:hypothetical protein